MSRTINSRSSRIDVAALLASSDLASLITADRGAPDRSRKWLCPFHDDHNPSLGLSRDGNRFRCWACGVNGNALDWLMKRDGLSFGEAASRLDPNLGQLQTPGKSPRRPQDDPAQVLSRDSVAALVETAAARLWMPEGAGTLAYLIGRGLTQETIRAARLGWTDRADGFAWKPPGLVIPWHDGGRVVFVKVRTPDAWRTSYPRDRRPPKYLAPRGWSQPGTIYPCPEAVRPGRPLVIVEGELDCLLLAQALGDLVAVVTLGSASNGPEPAILGRLLTAPSWLVAHDADEAGDRAAAHWNAYPRVRRVRPPSPFKDWTEAGTDTPDSTGTAIDLRRWWESILAGNEVPPAFTWDDLVRWRWGPRLVPDETRDHEADADHAGIDREDIQNVDEF